MELHFLILIIMTSFTEAYIQSGKLDGKIDPAQPDKVSGPSHWAPELGSLTDDDLSAKDLRDRLFAAKHFPNRASLARHYGGMAALETLLEDGKERRKSDENGKGQGKEKGQNGRRSRPLF